MYVEALYINLGQLRHIKISTLIYNRPLSYIKNKIWSVMEKKIYDIERKWALSGKPTDTLLFFMSVFYVCIRNPKYSSWTVI